MLYYNHEGKLVEYNPLERKSTIVGGCSNLYVFNNYIFKKYYTFVLGENRVKIDVFNALNAIDNRHLLKIYELLIEKEKYENNCDESKDIYENFLNMDVDAYTMPILIKDNTSVLDRKVEFILEMLSEMEELIKTISEGKILLQDIKPSNVLIEENNMILIDWDKYKLVPYELGTILNMNEWQILGLFASIFIEACNTYKEKEQMINLFDSISSREEVLKEKSLAMQLRERLNGYKSVREYMNGR